MIRHHRAAFVVTALAVAVFAVAGCGTADDDAADRAVRAVAPVTPAPAPDLPSPEPAADCADARASYAPDEPLPPPGEMPEGSSMRAIQDDGVLVVGVDENTALFAARNPFTNRIEGLEIDLVREIARAITGNPDAVRFETVLTAEKNQVVADGDVDLTASANSMTCERWSLVSFSTEYFTAFHKLMVRKDSGITGIADLAGREVCMTEGSSSVKLLATGAPDAVPVEVPSRTECLVALQNGDAEAYFGHDTFLRGMHEQDTENTMILPDVVEEQHYGIAVAHERTDLVRFVNALLQRMRDDGTLAELYDRWLGSDHAGVPDPRYRDEAS